MYQDTPTEPGLSVWFRDAKHILVTPWECAELMEHRRQALAAATQRFTGTNPLPVQWRRGWRATLAVRERDRDGTLIAKVRVDSPETTQCYLRRVRVADRLSSPANRTVVLTRRK